MTRTETSRMLHHGSGELSLCGSCTFRKSSRGIEAICDCLLRRERTEIGIGHDDGRSVATVVQRNDFPGNVRRQRRVKSKASLAREWPCYDMAMAMAMEGTGWMYARSTQLQFAAVPKACESIYLA
jgi:hypothetical protein